MSDQIVVTPEHVWLRLSKSVGEMVARDAVLSEMAKLGIRHEELNLELGLRVLESLAEREGLLGVTARFARSRWLLQGAREGLKSAIINQGSSSSVANGPRSRTSGGQG